jgi:hypothetical protein
MWPLSLSDLLSSGFEVPTLPGGWFCLANSCNFEVNGCVALPCLWNVGHSCCQAEFSVGILVCFFMTSLSAVPIFELWCLSTRLHVLSLVILLVFSGAGHFLSKWTEAWWVRTLICHTHGISVPPLLGLQAWNRTRPVEGFGYTVLARLDHWNHALLY